MKISFITTQLDVINYCKIYLNKIKKKSFISTNPFFYFTTWADTVGRVKLLSITKEFKFKYFKKYSLFVEQKNLLPECFWRRIKKKL